MKEFPSAQKMYEGEEKKNTMMWGKIKIFQINWNVISLQDLETLLVRNANGNKDKLVTLVNKSPSWKEETQSYVLNFHGRVTQASVKNFQIIHPDNGKMWLSTDISLIP